MFLYTNYSLSILFTFLLYRGPLTSRYDALRYRMMPKTRSRKARLEINVNSTITSEMMRLTKCSRRTETKLDRIARHIKSLRDIVWCCEILERNARIKKFGRLNPYSVG